MEPKSPNKINWNHIIITLIIGFILGIFALSIFQRYFRIERISDNNIKDTVSRTDTAAEVIESTKKPSTQLINESPTSTSISNTPLSTPVKPTEKKQSKIIPYIVNTNKPKIETALGEADNNELWIQIDEKKELLVSSRQDEILEKTICGINTPILSLDKTKVYFMSQAWVTSSAIHVVDINTRIEKFITAGEIIDLEKDGQYKGKLIISKRFTEDTVHYYKCIVDDNGKVLKKLDEIK